MSITYKLNFAQRSLSFDGKIKIIRGPFCGEDPSQFNVISNRKLTSYNYDGNNDNWLEQATIQLPAGVNEFLYFSDESSNIPKVLLIKTSTGINFYRCLDNNIKLLLKTEDYEENNFHDVYDWDKPNNKIICGQFYDDRHLIGIITKHEEYGINCYAIMKDELSKGSYPIWSLDTNLDILNEHHPSRTDYFLSDLKNIGKDCLIILGKHQINVYEFNKQNQMEHVYEISRVYEGNVVEEKLYFPQLTPNDRNKEIILLNSNGLFLYRYDPMSNNYRFVHHNVMFSRTRGWSVKHWESIQFFDVNSDGRQEMIFTGPHGIGIINFNEATSTWETLMDSFNLNVYERLSNVKAILPLISSTTRLPIVLTSKNNVLNWANLSAEFVEKIESGRGTFIEEQSNKTAIIPRVVLTNKKEEIPTLLLRHHVDYAPVLNSVDRTTGRLKFQIPLIDLSSTSSLLKFDISYDGTSVTSSDILGLGWSIAQNFIILDHERSIFPQDETYYIIIGNVPQQLEYDRKSSTGTVRSYKLGDLNVRYYENEERWELSSKDVRQYYGKVKNSGSVNWELSWHNWRGIGSSARGQKRASTAWYLAEANYKDTTIYFSYGTIESKTSSGTQFTRETYLKTIKDNQGNQIELDYSNKDKSEYVSPKLIDDNGNINTGKTQSKFLKGYVLNTPNYRQEILFDYRLEEGKRYLTSIEQVGDSAGPIFRFNYEKLAKTDVMAKITLPNGVTLNVNYKIAKYSNNLRESTTLYDVEDNFSVDQGDEDILISYVDKMGRVNLKLFDDETSSSLPYEFSPIGRGSIKAHRVYRGYRYFAITILNADNIQLYLYHTNEDNQWRTDTTSYDLPEDAKLRFGADFVIAKETREFIDVIEWNDKKQAWNRSTFMQGFSRDPLIACQNKLCVVYDEETFRIGYKDEEGIWQYKTSRIATDAIKSIKTTTNRFILSANDSKQVETILTNNALQLDKNLMALSSWTSVGLQLYSVIDYFVINRNYEIIHSTKIKIPQDDLSKVKEEVAGKDGNYFTLGYELKKQSNQVDKFQVVVKSFRGPIMDEILTKSPSASQVALNINDVKKEVTKQIGKPFLIDFRKYFHYLTNRRGLCNKNKMIYDGFNWIRSELIDKEVTSIPLGDAFVLRKDKTQFHLYRQPFLEKAVINVGVEHLNETLIKYPIYLARQERAKEIAVVTFTSDGTEILDQYRLPKRETIAQGTENTLITSSFNFNKEKNVTLTFHPTRRFDNVVIAKTSLNLNDAYKRLNGYDYDDRTGKLIGNVVYYANTTMVPGNDPESFGWIVESNNFQQHQTKGTRRKIYDAGGNLIKTIVPEEQERKQAPAEDYEIYANTTLYGINKRLEIGQFFPYQLPNEEVAYYGFEDYEINRIGGNGKRWNFQQNATIVHGNYSLTGNNYLQLNNNELSGTFSPKNQFQNYVASTWIRPMNNELTVGNNSPYLLANVFADDDNDNDVCSLMSEIKLQLNDWYYLEVIIDPLYARKLYDSRYPQNKGRTIRFTITIEINGEIHVDHVRFSPIRSNFKVNVYRQKVNVITENIHHNGLIEKIIYDQFYRHKVTTIDAYGQLGEINIRQDTNEHLNLGRPKCAVKIVPEYGFKEDFRLSSFQDRWNIEDATAWEISPNRLNHVTNKSDDLTLNLIDLDKESYGMRLLYALESEDAFVDFNGLLKIEKKTDKGYPHDGNLLVTVEENRLFVWIDGVLYVDGQLTNQPIDTACITIGGRVTISDMLVFSKPQVLVTYYNELDEKIQEVALESSTTVIVTGYLYDELGRQTITTVPTRLQRSSNDSLLTYHDKFVINDNPLLEDSVWKTHELRGDCARIAGRFAFSQTTYHDNPLNEKSADGLPGKEFSVNGPFGKRYSSSCKSTLIKELYPSNKNYTYLTEHRDDGIEDVSIYDANNNRVAWYVNVPGSSNILSTYEYDDKTKKLIKMLPPLYHETANTLKRFRSSSSNDDLQTKLCVHTTYDSRGNLLTKTTPDAGKVENFYDDNGFLKYTAYISRDDPNVAYTIVYFDYDPFGKLQSTGRLLQQTDLNFLRNATINDDDKKEVYQRFYYSDTHRKPLLRNNFKRYVTMNDGEPYVEESILNIHEETLSKRVIVPVKESDEPMVFAINKKYVVGMLKELEYPIEVNERPFKLVYGHDKFGRVNRIGIPRDEDLFLKINHNAFGQIEAEHYLPESSHNFTRHFAYNEPGFLTVIDDKYLTEKMFYTKQSYGGLGHGDGTITRTEFHAKWHDHYDAEEIGLRVDSFVNRDVTLENSQICFDKLKETDHLDERNRQKKIFYPHVENTFPFVCRYGTVGRRIAHILGSKGFPTKYGHSYDYGNHKELTKAKYFVGDDDLLQPLKPDTFSKEITGINVTLSRDIWNRLSTSGYIITDNDKADLLMGQGKRGKSFINENLFDDLLTIRATRYLLPLQTLLTTYVAENKLPTLREDIRTIFEEWHAGQMSARLNEELDDIAKMLEEKHYFTNPFSTKFLDSMKKYESFVPGIVSTLSRHFAQQLGEAEFDVESYGIDSNGNHKHYYTGFDRYELEYDKLTNRIGNVKHKSFRTREPEKTFKMTHDDRGNVVQALHKGIKRIVYDPISNRTRLIALTDGTSLIFAYDSKGERVLKMVMKGGKTMKKIYYMRDESGRSLVEKEIRYYSKDLPPDILITIYIYNENKLIGFIRRDEFHNVITDHEGSVRLIVRNGEVVAAYDYLPYGNLMREYGNNPEVHISYRYTGQEWDEETRLYNYHARFYDPDIGRFYQIDPKEQYFSPYKYAGNSPVSKIDPDGEFAFLIACIVLGIIGAYVGGAAANRNANPLKWNWKSGKTYLGIFGGAVSGALLPVGFAGSVSFLTGLGASTALAAGVTAASGVAGAYIKISLTVGDWNPGKWNFKSMELWNAAFEGFTLGSGALHGVGSIKSYFSRLSTKGKYLFVAGSSISGVGIFALNGFATQWDFTRPAIYFGFIDAIFSATDLPIFLAGSAKFVGKNIQKIRNNLKALHLGIKAKQYVGGRMSRTLQKLREAKNTVAMTKALEGGGNILLGTASVGIAGYLMGSGENDSFNDWSNSRETYFALLTGILLGGNVASATKNFYRKLKLNQKIKANERVLKMMEKVAGEVVDSYKKVIIYGDFDKNSLDYSIAVKKRLQEGKIPNVAVAVSVTKDMVVVSFSTNPSPGFIVYYQRKSGADPTIIFEKFVVHNVDAGNGAVVLHENPAKNLELLKETELKQDAIRDTNKQTFVNENVRQKMSAIISESGIIPEGNLNGLMTAVSDKFNEIGYMRKDALSQILQNHGPMRVLVDQETSVRKNMQKLKKEIKQNKKPTDEQTSKFKAQMEGYEQEIVNIESSKKIEFEKIKELTGKLWPEVEHFEDPFTFWDPTNCAEPHCLTALTRTNEIIPVTNDKLNYDIKREDVLFMGTYKLDNLPELTPFTRCDHCLITTKDINTVLTDPGWRELIQHKLTDSKTKFNFAIERLFFKQPYMDLLKIWKNGSLTIDDEPILNRKRRSIREDEMTFVQEKSSGASAATSWITNCVHWIKDSFEEFRETLFNQRNHHQEEEYDDFKMLNMGDRQFGNVDINGTALLLDYLFAKYNKRKIFATFRIDDRTFNDMDALGFSLDITEKFENDINDISSTYGINKFTIGFEDLMRLQKEIRKKILQGKYDDIHTILTNTFWNICRENDVKPTLMRDLVLAFDEIVLNRLAKFYAALDEKFATKTLTIAKNKQDIRCEMPKSNYNYNALLDGVSSNFIP